MTTVFTRIINGEIPGTFVYRDPTCAAFMSINPIAPGHVLVVPVVEVDHWIDLPVEVATHVFAVAQSISRAQYQAFDCDRIGVIVAGYEVNHCHVHLIPTRSMADLDFRHAAPSVERARLEAESKAIKASLESMKGSS